MSVELYERTARNESQITHLIKAIDELHKLFGEMVEIQKKQVAHDASTKSAHHRITELKGRIDKIEESGGCSVETCPLKSKVDRLDGWHTWVLRIIVGGVLVALLAMVGIGH